jgi:hypothetical protein
MLIKEEAIYGPLSLQKIDVLIKINKTCRLRTGRRDGMMGWDGMGWEGGWLHEHVGNLSWVSAPRSANLVGHRVELEHVSVHEASRPCTERCKLAGSQGRFQFF